MSSKSRTDFFLVSSSALQFVKSVSHSFAPFSDHKQVHFKLGSIINETPTLHGYCKFNNAPLKDAFFNDSIIKNLINDIFWKH